MTKIHLRLERSTSPIRDSTVLMHSNVNVKSISFITCLLLSLYRYSTSRGARAWIYGVLMLRSGCRNIVLNVCTHFSFTWCKFIYRLISKLRTIHNFLFISSAHRHVFRLECVSKMINARKLKIGRAHYFWWRVKHEYRDTQHHSHFIHFSFVVPYEWNEQSDAIFFTFISDIS